MRTAQLLEQDGGIPAYGEQAEARGENDNSVTTQSRNWQALSDCHSAEHLLIGTHRLDSQNRDTPVCLTCKFQSAA